MGEWQPIDTVPKNRVVWLRSEKDGPVKGMFFRNLHYKFGGYWQINKARWPAGGPQEWRDI